MDLSVTHVFGVRIIIIWTIRADQGAVFAYSLLEGHPKSFAATVFFHNSRLTCEMTHFSHHITLTCGQILSFTFPGKNVNSYQGEKYDSAMADSSS